MKCSNLGKSFKMYLHGIWIRSMHFVELTGKNCFSTQHFTLTELRKKKKCYRIECESSMGTKKRIMLAILSESCKNRFKVVLNQFKLNHFKRLHWYHRSTLTNIGNVFNDHSNSFLGAKYICWLPHISLFTFLRTRTHTLFNLSTTKILNSCHVHCTSFMVGFMFRTNVIFRQNHAPLVSLSSGFSYKHKYYMNLIDSMVFRKQL